MDKDEKYEVDIRCISGYGVSFNRNIRKSIEIIWISNTNRYLEVLVNILILLLILIVVEVGLIENLETLICLYFMRIYLSHSCINNSMLFSCRAMGDVSDRIGRPTDNGQVSILIYVLFILFMNYCVGFQLYSKLFFLQPLGHVNHVLIFSSL